MKKEIKSDSAPRPIGPYSQGIAMNNFLFTAGQIALDPETGNLIEGNIKDQAGQVMKHLGAILSAAGFSFNDVLKCSIFLTDLSDFANVNEVYGSYFENPYPVRETVEVSKLPKGANVEISVIAGK